jgi:peroxiredoxin
MKIFSFFFLFASILQAQQIKDFSLPDVDGKNVSLSNFKKAKGFIVVFSCNHCPFAQFYHERLNLLNKKYKKHDLHLISVNPMDTLMYGNENLTEMKNLSLKNNFNFPYLLDASQQVAKNFNAVRTPQAFLIWKEKDKYVVKYSGAIDDNGAEPEKVQNNYLEDAIISQLKGKTIKNPNTTSVGCKIIYRKSKG